MDIFNTPYLYAKRYVATTMLNTDIFVFCRYDPDRDDKYQNYIVSFPNLVAAVAAATPGVNSVTGYNVNNTDPANPIILPVQVDGITITGSGVIGDPFVAVSSGASILTGKTIWVDATNGNDGTGTRGRQDLPFLTIAAAQAVALSGDTIHVRPGTYTDSGLGANGINFYYEKGAVQTASGALFLNTGNCSYSVTGHGRFTSTSNSVILCTNSALVNSVIFFQANYILATGVGSRTIWNFGNAEIVLEVETDLVLTGQEQVIRQDSTGIVHVTCNRMIGAGGLIQIGNGSTSYTIVYAKELIYEATGNGYVGLNPGGGYTEVHGDIYFNGNGLYGLPGIYGGAGTAVMKIYGDIYSTSTDGTVIVTNTALDFYGNIESVGLMETNTGSVVHYHGRVRNTYANVLRHIAGKTVVHDLVVGSADGILVAANGLILKQTAAIVTAGDSVTAGAAQTIKTYPGAVANTAVNVNITETISTLTVNAAVDSE